MYSSKEYNQFSQSKHIHVTTTHYLKKKRNLTSVPKGPLILCHSHPTRRTTVLTLNSFDCLVSFCTLYTWIHMVHILLYLIYLSLFGRCIHIVCSCRPLFFSLPVWHSIMWVNLRVYMSIVVWKGILLFSSVGVLQMMLLWTCKHEFYWTHHRVDIKSIILKWDGWVTGYLVDTK